MELHTNGLLANLVLSLVAAFGGGLAVRVIKLPPMLGYLLAGILIGPWTPGISADMGMASDLAEIGVALLLFNIGLHFSIKDLISVRRIAVSGALLQMTISFAVGFSLALFLFGKSLAVATIIGLALSVASTAISSRLLDEKRQVATLPGRIAVGWLVVQDIVAILAMVLIPTFLIRPDQSIDSLVPTLGRTLLQIAGFVVVMLFGVRRYIPKLLEYVARIGSRELFTLAVIVIALGIAYGSAMIFGVSIALGAFFAGVAIAESDLNHHAAAEALSLQQIFSILFFVSVGMLFDPSSILRMPAEIFTLWLAIVIGMGFVTFLILVGMHVPAHAAALVGGVFAQVGEMSFVLGQLGSEWGILTRDDRDLILAVAIISIVLNPLLSRLFLGLGRWASASNFIMRWQRYGEASIPEVAQPLSGHVILIGHGRVGQRVAEALRRNSIPYVVIESDRRLMEKLRRQGTSVIFGDATREQVFTVAQPELAKLLIITTPQWAQVKQIIMLAKKINPKLEITVRVHEELEARYMARLGINLAVMSEKEVALGLSAYALQHYGVESTVVLETLNVLRE